MAIISHINVNNAENPIASNNMLYGVCSTAAATAAKTVTISNSKFTLQTGATIVVKFTITNTAANPTLNVDGTGAKAIYYNGPAITAGYLKANKVYEFIYNGTQWDLIGDVDTTLPTASSSTLGGIKVGSNLSISGGKLSVPAANGDTAGVTVVYPAANCTTFSSDSGTVTPLAVQKGAKMFAITRPPKKDSGDKTVTVNAVPRWENTSGDIKNSKITIEDVTNTKDTSKTANVLVIPAEGGKKMVYGYCTDQTDGTSFIGGVFPANATEYPYASGLAIGGTSGNLLWKGVKVTTTADLDFKGAVSTIKDSNLTASRALVSNSSGKVAVSAVTSTELSYLDGVTSNIQTQLNSKVSTSSVDSLELITVADIDAICGANITMITEDGEVEF